MAAIAGRGRNFSTETALRAPIERVSVIGSGLMGSGIAQVNNKYIDRGKTVEMYLNKYVHAEFHEHHAPSP